MTLQWGSFLRSTSSNFNPMSNFTESISQNNSVKVVRIWCRLLLIHTMKLTVEKATAVLGLSKEFSEETLRTAYKKAALRWHPDKNPDNRPAAEEKFKEVSAAYTKLSKHLEGEESNDSDDGGACVLLFAYKTTSR